MATNGNGIGKVVLSALIGVVVAGSGAWLSLASRTPTREEVKEIMDRESPYMLDRKLIQDRIGRSEDAIKQLAQEMVTIKGGQIRIESKLDTLIEFEKRRRP